MHTISVFRLVVILAQLLALPQVAFCQYILAAGGDENSLISFYNLDDHGRLSLQSRFDLRDYQARYLVSVGSVAFSGNGNYIFVQGGWDNFLFRRNAGGDLDLLFFIDDNFCGGGGFSSDERYFFATTRPGFDPTGPVLKAWRLSPTSCTLVFSEQQPSTSGLIGRGNPFIWTDKEELIGETNGLSSGFGINIYQFDRQSESLSLKQYLEKSIWGDVYASDESSNKILCTDGWYLLSFVREEGGSFITGERVRLPGMDRGKEGISFLPDGKHAVVLIYDTQGDAVNRGGPKLLRVGPQGQLIQLAESAPIPYALSMAVTPDGRFCVVGYPNGAKIGVFKISLDPPALTEVFTLTGQPLVWGMAFHPTALPPAAAGKEWAIYK